MKHIERATLKRIAVSNTLSPIDTKEFKRWFGKSKVMRNGKPLVMYHGTTKAFRRFDPTKIGTSKDFGYYGWGFYFTENYNDAKAYGFTGEPLAVYLSLQNPVVLHVSQAVDLGALRTLLPADVPVNSPKAITKYFRSQGHDGLLVVANGRIQEAVVFDMSWTASERQFFMDLSDKMSAKIKSAFENSGAFDKDNPDIYE